METELNVYLSEVTDDGLELSGTLDDSIYGFAPPILGIRSRVFEAHVCFSQQAKALLS